jgi:hypothetical protein
MNQYLKITRNYQVELKGDLLMIKSSSGDLLKAMAVPAAQAVQKFNEMINRVIAIEETSNNR